MQIMFYTCLSGFSCETGGKCSKHTIGMALMITASSQLQPVSADKHKSFCLPEQAEIQNIFQVLDCEKKRAYGVSQVCKATPNS